MGRGGGREEEGREGEAKIMRNFFFRWTIFFFSNVLYKNIKNV